MLGRELRWRDRIDKLPLPRVAELRVDGEQVVGRGGPRSTGADDDQRSLDIVGRGLVTVLGVPGLDAQAVHEAIDDDRLDPLRGGGIGAEVDGDRGHEVFEAVLPSVRSEVR
jgi:hypothetical protein